MIADTLSSCVAKTVQLLINEYRAGKIDYNDLNSFIKFKLEFLEGNLYKVKKRKIKEEVLKILSVYNEIFISHENPFSKYSIH